jgi:hypothetical protein
VRSDSQGTGSRERPLLFCSETARYYHRPSAAT